MNETENNLKELTEQLYDNLTKTINEFKEKLEEREKEKKPKTAWDLKTGDEYWYLTNDGTIYQSCWDDVPLDEKRRITGNMFLTEEDAHIELQKREVEALLEKHGGVPFRKLNHVYNMSNRVVLYLDYTGSDEIFIAKAHMGSGLYAENMIPFGFENLMDADNALNEIGASHLIAYACGELYEDD